MYVVFTCRLQQSTRTDFGAIRERSETFFTHQDLRTQPRTSGLQQNQGTQQSQSQRSNCHKDLTATRKRNIAVIGITAPNAIAMPPAQAILATTGVVCVIRRITPCYIVPKGNSLTIMAAYTSLSMVLVNCPALTLTVLWSTISVR